MPTTTIDQAEIEKFSRIAATWWNPDGPFRPLHRLNPVRLAYVHDQACRHFDRDARAAAPLKGLTALDIGCGGGLVAEPLARMGAKVTGIDADAQAIAVAKTHSADRGLAIDYQIGSAEVLAVAGRRFDLVTALEIVEHVADREMFLDTLVGLVAPEGLVILSTLNRSLKSLVLGIGVAEHLLRWVEPGTHDWRKFVRPSELARGLRTAGLDPVDLTGLVFDALKGEFRLRAGDVGVNYLMTARPA